MSKNSINDRISELIEFLDITPTAFADEIGIQRSGLSHIMKGRNKPSLDVVQKIINRFPEINILWLVNGTGAMSSSIPSVINLQQKPQTVKKEDDNALKNDEIFLQECKGTDVYNLVIGRLGGEEFMYVPTAAGKFEP